MRNIQTKQHKITATEMIVRKAYRFEFADYNNFDVKWPCGAIGPGSGD